MSNDWSRPLSGGPDDDDLLADAPDLKPMRTAAERAELAAAKSCLANSYGFRLRDDDPVAPLARDLAEQLTLAGFTLHHCAQSDPLYRLGGVCLLPVAAGSFPREPGGAAVSWTAHLLLTLDWARWGEGRGVQEAMNSALRAVLDALGFAVQPFGQAGASLVTGRRSAQQPEAGQ